jgi:hypothetical protein
MQVSGDKAGDVVETYPLLNLQCLRTYEPGYYPDDFIQGFDMEGKRKLTDPEHLCTRKTAQSFFAVVTGEYAILCCDVPSNIASHGAVSAVLRSRKLRHRRGRNFQHDCPAVLTN